MGLESLGSSEIRVFTINQWTLSSQNPDQNNLQPSDIRDLINYSFHAGVCPFQMTHLHRRNDGSLTSFPYSTSSEPQATLRLLIDISSLHPRPLEIGDVYRPLFTFQGVFRPSKRILAAGNDLTLA